MSQFTRVTDRQTDGQTDRILIARPRLHSMQRGKKLLANMTKINVKLVVNFDYITNQSTEKPFLIHKLTALITRPD